jgi:hypothetical protein
MEALAATIVGNFLVPYLKLGAEALAGRLAGDAGDAAGKQTAEVAKRIWERVKHAFSGDPSQAAALEQFEKRPEAFGPGVEAMLAELLTNDDRLATELRELTSSADETAVRIMAETVGYVDARNAVQHGGVIAGVYHGQPRRSTSSVQDQTRTR